ncbi:hypothetical protein [uncultured Chryseobacterium sp.]|uniref:hypothetical protein n=1 Tax=uncultured Chryseobacterium sp. TaxID=259322 RepID=UPI0025864BC5|nr:hypothetical protein [uncultured Chryseobacterium sp.]
MKNLLFPLCALAVSIIACQKKYETQSTTSVSDSTTIIKDSSPTDSALKETDSTSGRDSINTKDHIGGRKTSNNNTGNAEGNINAAVSDSARPKR